MRTSIVVAALGMLLLVSLGPLLQTAGADEGRSVVRQRAQEHVFTWNGNASVVEVHGEWNAWTSGSALVEVAPDTWQLNLPLSPGMYCYKFVIDGVWTMDEANAYSGYCGDIENSIARVINASNPTYEASLNGDELTVEWVAGLSGAGPSGTPSALAGAAWDEGTWTWSLDVAGFDDGKHVLHLEGTASDGTQAEDVLLPFWTGPQAEFVWDDALIYMVMTDRFVNGDPSNDPAPLPEAAHGAGWMGGDFAGVQQMIESGYFAELGVNVLWLTPFNTAANGTGLAADGVHEVAAYHGYWPVEARGVDQRLGSPQELEDLVEAAHDAGLRVMADFVVNHVHEDHPYVTEHPDWFNDGCICGEPGCDWTEHRLECLFRSYMPDVDWRNRNASEAMIEDVLWWMETFDLDGGRIDAVKHVEDLAVTNLATRVSERFETLGNVVYLKGETAMGWSGHLLADNAEQYGTINRYMGEQGLEGQADFVLYHAVADRVFTSGQEDYMHLDYWTARSQDQYVDGAIMVPFVGSHDVPRLVSRADPGTADAWNQWIEQGLPGQPGTLDPYRASLQAHAWLLTVPGAPMIYMGDEYGEYGGADPDNRHMWREDVTWTDNEQALWTNISDLGQLRLELESLRRGGYASLHNASDVIVFERATDEASTVVALNRATTSVNVSLGAGYVHHTMRFGDGLLNTSNGDLTVPPHGVVVISNEDQEAPENVPGCMDANATNHNPAATFDDGSCTYPPADVPGCMDANATNHDPNATVDDGSCTYPPADVPGCMDANATNFNANATVDDGSCIEPNPEPEPISGCTDANATNFNANATLDDGSCIEPNPEPEPISGCTDANATNYDANATLDDGSCIDPPEEPVEVEGCTDANATNFNANATLDDGTCIVGPSGTDDQRDASEGAAQGLGGLAAALAVLVLASILFVRKRAGNPP